MPGKKEEKQTNKTRVVVIARGQPKECKRQREREMARKGKREREGKTKRQKTQCNVSKLAKVPNKRRGRWVGGGGCYFGRVAGY